ncbi:MAG TPA: hypothetical protein VJ932_12310, partial [Alkalispirochaeta sp.]|nr:hypothetical protein [Alkalispirochaeta sp.]
GSVPVLVVADGAPVWVALSVISLPLAVRLLARVARASGGAELMDLPMRSAQLHLVTGILYTAGFVLGGVLG